jgi:hypothetical protein
VTVAVAQQMLRRYNVNSQLLTGKSGMSWLPLRDSFDHMLADLFSTEKSHRPRIIFAFDDGQPGNTVIEHGGGCDESGILKSYID